VPRNSASSAWTTRVDFRIDQELPGFFEGHKASAFLVVKNLGNFLNDEWGITKQGAFKGASVVEADVNDDGTYTYTGVLPANAEQNIFQTQSLWEVKVGVKYRF
jgi:hypothetical protein